MEVEARLASACGGLGKAEESSEHVRRLRRYAASVRGERGDESEEQYLRRKFEEQYAENMDRGQKAMDGVEDWQEKSKRLMEFFKNFEEEKLEERKEMLKNMKESRKNEDRILLRIHYYGHSRCFDLIGDDVLVERGRLAEDERAVKVLHWMGSRGDERRLPYEIERKDSINENFERVYEELGLIHPQQDEEAQYRCLKSLGAQRQRSAVWSLPCHALPVRPGGVLHMAAESGNEVEVQRLLGAGAPINETDESGATPLFTAALNGHEGVVSTLVDAGADKDKAENDHGATPLYAAALEGEEGVVSILVRAGVDKNKPDKNGATPLFIAALHGHKGVVSILLRAGADKDKEESDGGTPLYVAAECGHKDLVSLLLNHGADRDKATHSGTTPLFVASQFGHLEVVSILLQAGADRHKAFFNGRTPIEEAIVRGHYEIVLLLQETPPRSSQQYCWTCAKRGASNRCTRSRKAYYCNVE
uniref:Uncharacterized protein n=1 Tax=Chromera velia CCMP2878 TaxID=1169474 RepID=A0A0G4HHH6_9ALVE|eukprot:Cvel_6812.t1-p1 / transcript=Cvel_6812.t1 / gene=Cvel_6812 / organism=Chromera_velia_CCMP2878 / gene_product=Ankyrin repeat domain-containing protein 50, putative / transcript_product=Ankyrin repeat domain-containing protein 50, putative / location=Cvel_scaffold343:38240-43059(-) / protein_length=475 / sequence_SO=supercontig / SO=protein_coding / is_pseudo=false